ncbi:uridine kinase [Thalassotalea sp. 1_MG-2023]|uniref:uridine kinase n=1 Tax=Thalassotalea sp. 1_MG-2023 TaxID=3062680 RepID=UPI0026E17846|nr:uridine kinase [Thalassotalea sp. 1_MG-2023]MDO6427746.1 uridine kinase [Thalassotalea sp. 1_MG-2023]
MLTNKTTIIAISGASASGKSLFAQTIYQELFPELGKNGIAIIKEDAYYKNQDHIPLPQRIETNYDHPNAFEHTLLAEQLRMLQQGKDIECPVYCYKTHTRLTDTITIPASPIILVEGILLFADQNLRECFDLKIYMDTPLDICLLRRIKRDIEERDRDIDSITQQYEQTVRPMYHQFIAPSKSWADIIVNKGGKNRMAIEVIKAKIRQLIQQ